MFGISKRAVSLKEIIDQISFLKSKSLYIESNGKIYVGAILKKKSNFNESLKKNTRYLSLKGHKEVKEMALKSSPL